jgi:aryl-alcohol dehydrogenase-like predicted oxidoreductase
LGTSLASLQDAKFCTKIGYDISSGKPVKNYDLKFLEASLLSSMQRLNRNYIDLLLLHNPPTEVLEQPQIYKWLNSKIKDGTTLQWGVSVYDSVQDAKLALNEGAQAIEARYSLLRRDIIDELPKNQWSFQFIARSPLDGGLLSGKYTGNETFPSTDQRSAQKFEYIKTNHSFLKELQPLLDQGIASSFPELAIRFAAFAPNVSVVIPGAKSVIQVEENVSAVKRGPLPPSAIQLIDNLREKYTII